MRIGFVGSSYTARSTALADEDCINFFAETVESQGAVVPAKAYGGSNAQSVKGYFGTPGLLTFATLPSNLRGSCVINGRVWAVGGTSLCEVNADGTFDERDTVASDGKPASLAPSSIEVLTVSGGNAYCLTVADATVVDVTVMLAAQPIKVEYGDGYFIVIFKDSNKFQVSAILDGTTWPGLQVNEVSVFPENIVSIVVNHRELWVFGNRHTQVYQNTGSDEIYDVIPSGLIQQGCAATFSPCLIDNSVFWIGEDDGGGRIAWRSNGYTPQRISTHAVEFDLSTYADISGLVSYTYQDEGHLFWVLYIPGSQWSWCFDVVESLWHKRAAWITESGSWGAHHSWNHVYAFGKHLVGDWATGNLYEMNLDFLDDDGAVLRSLRRAPTIENEMEWIYHTMLTLDFEVGLGPQPPFLDGNGNPRPPQAILRWSDDRGKTWSNEHILDLGFAGEFRKRVIQRRLGRSRYRVYELVITDPIKRALLDAYLKVGNGE